MMMIDILLLAAVAIWILVRYKSMLGMPPDDDVKSRAREQRRAFDAKTSPDKDNVVPIKPVSIKPSLSHTEHPSVAATLAQIKMTDSHFDDDNFVEGAKKAFSMIVAAYADGDKDTLKNLLDKAVYKSFAAAIEERTKNQHTMEFSLERLKSAEIIEASLNNTLAQITLRFKSEQITVTRDKNGVVVDGSPDRLVSVTDIWTFERDLKAADPTWYLQRTTTA